MEKGQSDTYIRRIEENYSSLNNSEKKVARYVLENPRDIVHFTITELADQSDVSDASVFRFCQKIGYNGYQELKINLASMYVKPIENIHEEVKETDDTYMIMHKVFNSNIYSMKKTIKLNKPQDLEKSANIIANSSQVMFFGMGGSGVIAGDAYHKFVRTGLKCCLHTDSHWQAMIAATASSNDVIIAFSNSGSNKELFESLKIGKKNGVKIISITGNIKSPIARISDITLVSYGKESMFRSEAMESRLTALALIDCIYVKVALERKEETLENLEKIRNGIALKRF